MYEVLKSVNWCYVECYKAAALNHVDAVSSSSGGGGSGSSGGSSGSGDQREHRPRPWHADYAIKNSYTLPALHFSTLLHTVCTILLHNDPTTLLHSASISLVNTTLLKTASTNLIHIALLRCYTMCVLHHIEIKNSHTASVLHYLTLRYQTTPSLGPLHANLYFDIKKKVILARPMSFDYIFSGGTVCTTRIEFLLPLLALYYICMFWDWCRVLVVLQRWH